MNSICCEVSMPTQYQIEQSAGITDREIAEYVMGGKTHNAKSAMDLLKIQCSFYEPQGFELLKHAISECKREMASANT